MDKIISIRIQYVDAYRCNISMFNSVSLYTLLELDLAITKIQFLNTCELVNIMGLSVGYTRLRYLNTNNMPNLKTLYI